MVPTTAALTVNKHLNDIVIPVDPQHASRLNDSNLVGSPVRQLDGVIILLGVQRRRSERIKPCRVVPAFDHPFDSILDALVVQERDFGGDRLFPPAENASGNFRHVSGVPALEVKLIRQPYPATNRMRPIDIGNKPIAVIQAHLYKGIRSPVCCVSFSVTREVFVQQDRSDRNRIGKQVCFRRRYGKRRSRNGSWDRQVRIHSRCRGFACR